MNGEGWKGPETIDTGGNITLHPIRGVKVAIDHNGNAFAIYN